MMKYIVLIVWCLILISGQKLDTLNFIGAMQLNMCYTIFMLFYYDSILKNMKNIYAFLMAYYFIVFISDLFISHLSFGYVVFESLFISLLIALQFDKDNLKCNNKDI